MKKIFIVLLASLSFSLFAADKSDDVLAKVFDPKMDGYEFYVKNPFLYEELFVSDLDLVKGKFLKMSTLEYDLYEDGSKGYSDSDYPLELYHYYLFDKQGYVTHRFELMIGHDGEFYGIKHQKFSKDGNIFKNRIAKYRRREGSVKKDNLHKYYNDYEIKVLEDSVELSELNAKHNKYIVYEKQGNKTLRKEYMPTRENLTSVTEFSGENFCIKKFYNGELKETTNYYHGHISVDNYLSERKDCRYHPAGFLEYKRFSPKKDGTPGFYSEMKAELLDGPDEMFVKYLRMELNSPSW